MLKKNKFKIVAICSLAILSLGLISCGENLTVKESLVQGHVVEREYEPSKKEKVKTDKKDSKGKPIYKEKKKSSEYEVDIAYEDLEVEVDSQPLYNKVKVGDVLTVTLKEYVNSKNETVRREIVYN